MSAVCLLSADCLLLFILAFRAQKDMGTYVIEGVELKIDAKIDLLGRQQPQRPPILEKQPNMKSQQMLNL